MKVEFTLPNGFMVPYIIGIRHLRENKWGPHGKLLITERGGITILSNIPPTTDPHYTNIYTAKVHPEDVYNKKLGLIYCLHELIWREINPAFVIKEFTHADGGQTMKITLQDYGVDVVGYLNKNALKLARFKKIPIQLKRVK